MWKIIGKTLSSKVFWTGLIAVAIQVFPGVKQFLTPEAADIASTILVALAGVFHINTMQAAVSKARTEAFQEAVSRFQN